MKRIGVLILVLAIFSSCNNSADLERKADSVGRKVDSFSNKVWDSGKKEIKELKGKIEDHFQKKDSANK